MQVVVRSLRVLRLLARSPQGLTLGEISTRLDLPMATTHRLVNVLCGEEFVSRSPSNRRFFLGPAAQEFGHASAPRQSMLVTPHEAIGAASRTTGETTFLSEMSGSRVVCLALVESEHPLRLFVRVGQTMPLHAAASARVLLAWREDGDVRRLLSEHTFPAFTTDTPTDAAAVLDRLRQIRERGYDICESELDEDVWAVSAPVRASTGVVVASVTIAAPHQRARSNQERAALTAAALGAAARMSADLGWAGPGTHSWHD
jgi:DNA-binding IclR family transcriptional regulator